MAILVNLRHLGEKNVSLEGKLPVEELDLDARDELIQAPNPLEYSVEVQQLEHNLLVQGRLHLTLSCQCARCLKPFAYPLELNPYVLHVPLAGEEKVEVVSDCVDLTPFFREDILLEFPQHPLCNPDCRGLSGPLPGHQSTGSVSHVEDIPSAWAELNKLKF
jgi:uncharacterized protein